MAGSGTYQERALRLLARQAKAEALAANKARTEETRRKIVLGGVVLALIKAGELTQDQVNSWVDRQVKAARDRKLFGL